MGSVTFDLNEQQHENRGGSLHYVLLQKDCKNICRTKVCDLPIEVPSIWSIISFMPIKAYQKRDLPTFSLLPDPEDGRQKTEWGKFTRFLSDNKKAAIARCGSSTFHILPPQSDECSNFSHAVLLYECGQNGPGDCNQIAVTSGRHVNGAAVNSSKRSYKSEVQYGSRNSKPPYFKEEICDSGPDPKGMETSPKHRNPHVTELHTPVPESSPRESVEDSPRVLNPVVKKRMASPTKNFIVADPSYLRTLSQTHAGWIFGAIAELIDNSRDAGAFRLNISVESLFSKKAQRKIPVLSVIDDGHGMTYADLMRMISFGHKRPTDHREDQIGRFGIGFKTGAMKLGKDAIVLTQTSSSRSVAFLSQSFNEGKDNVEIPVVAYRKEGQYMEVDLSVQSEATAEYNLNAIKEFSSFNEYFIGEKLGLFGEERTGTQIYIWNLDRWGNDYTLEWNSGKSSENPVHNGRGDILIRSRRVRSRPGQTSNKVMLDYSLQSYLEVMFLNPRMKISVQGSLVKSRPLAKTLNKTSVISGEIMGRTILLTLGRSKVEWDRTNCGIFLYWHGRLIESYKRVGGQKHSADMGRGVIGVVDITNLIDDGDGNSWVLNSKQGFQDCEMYAKLEEWLGRKLDEYWDTHFDNLELRKGDERHKPDCEWVQCYSCRKWRMLNAGFNTDSLPEEWFCYMPPFNGKCEVPEQQMGRGVIVIGEKRSAHDEHNKTARQGERPKKEMRPENLKAERITQDDGDTKNVRGTQEVNKRSKSSSGTPSKPKDDSDDDLEGGFSQTDDGAPRPALKRLRRGPAKIYKC
ncbi:MORC family CW-type zinc finger protein 3-like isoform X2 [Panicum virgatum]|nr:MORC family CW-type zinc finger protein 3-like isoform X2 [Panicum virgatum]